MHRLNLKSRFNYNAEQGILEDKSGQPVGWMDRGYIRISIDNSQYLAHRIIWEITRGNTPEFIDHIDRNGLNNKLNNLRETTKEANAKNCKVSKNSSTGFTGVFYMSKKDRYCARITNNKKRQEKTFLTIEEAIKCRQDWEKEFGYGSNKQ